MDQSPSPTLWTRLATRFWKPAWLKQAHLTAKGAQKFLHYKRDLLSGQDLHHIQTRLADLRDAIKRHHPAAAKEAMAQLQSACDKSLPRHCPSGWMAENLEVLWVALVIALGVRTYYLQPFRIPTGSMQPTLNGIIARPADDPAWKKPAAPIRLADFFLKGRKYYDLRAERDLTIRQISDRSFFIFPRTVIEFTDGSAVTIPAPFGEALGIPSIRSHVTAIKDARTGQLHWSGEYQKGETIFRGTLTSGDLVLVNKFAYHFRRPKRAESFVFTTNGIRNIQLEGRLRDQSGNTHYIKRLAGLPGDTVQIKAPLLYLNGQRAPEKNFQKIMDRLEVGPGERYTGYVNRELLATPTNQVQLANPADSNQREYFALGDNSPNSSDSRYWGTVKQHNLVGPALMSLWPFTSGHWGFIK